MGIFYVFLKFILQPFFDGSPTFALCGIIVFFIAQLVCLKSKKLAVKLIPSYVLVLFLILAVCVGILSMNSWAGFGLPFVLVALPTVFFGFGDLLAWIVYKLICIKREEKQIKELTDKK